MNIVKDFNIGQPVFIYKNLTRKCWSIKQKGLVVAYTNSIIIKDVTCIVNEKGRLRVLKEKQKNVHAYLKGVICNNIDLIFENIITYNPYYNDTFITNDIPVHKLKYAQLSDKVRGIL